MWATTLISKNSGIFLKYFAVSERIPSSLSWKNACLIAPIMPSDQKRLDLPVSQTSLCSDAVDTYQDPIFALKLELIRNNLTPCPCDHSLAALVDVWHFRVSH